MTDQNASTGLKCRFCEYRPVDGKGMQPFPCSGTAVITDDDLGSCCLEHAEDMLKAAKAHGYEVGSADGIRDGVLGIHALFRRVWGRLYWWSGTPR